MDAKKGIFFHLDSHSRNHSRLNVFCRIKATSKVLLDCVSLGLQLAAKSLSLDSQAQWAHFWKLLVNLLFLFSLAKFLFEQVHAVQKQYFLGSIIHTGFLRFGLRKLLRPVRHMTASTDHLHNDEAFQG